MFDQSPASSDPLMNARIRTLLLTATAMTSLIGAPKETPAAGKPTSELARLEQMAARFVPTELAADLSQLAPADRAVLAKLIQASKIVDGIFLRQVWSGNTAMLLDLARDGTPEGRARLHYFRINKGPWSRLDEDKPFVASAPPKPENAAFYPDDATQEEI